MLNGQMAVFTTWGENPYETDIVRSAVDAIAKNTAKLKPQHIRREGKRIHPVPGAMANLLQFRPNPNMSTYDFIYKMITTLMINNNAFAYPHWTERGLEAIWPVNCTRGDIVQDDTGRLFVRFTFGAGQQVVIPYSEVIHLRRHFYDGDIWGAANTAMNTTLHVIHTADEGLANAIKTSANLRGIIKFQGILKDADIKANRDRFVKEYMTINNDGGIAAMDAKADYTELKGEPKTANAQQRKELRDTVYRYFGVSEAIVSGDYDEDQWNAFYSSTVEPLAIQMSQEFTYKLFTGSAMNRGNEIIFSANRLAYASNTTKINMGKELIPMGLFTINEMREVWELEPVEGGDRRILSLNYVNADKADKYQLGEEPEPEPPEPKPKEPEEPEEPAA
jgi:HK97 family phage portal protein